MVDLSVVFRKRLPGRVTRIHPDFPQMMFSSRDIADIPEEYHALIPTGAYWAYWNMNESGMIKLEFPKRYFKRRDVNTCSRFPFSKCTGYCVYIYIYQPIPSSKKSRFPHPPFAKAPDVAHQEGHWDVHQPIDTAGPAWATMG